VIQVASAPGTVKWLNENHNKGFASLVVFQPGEPDPDFPEHRPAVEIEDRHDKCRVPVQLFFLTEDNVLVAPSPLHFISSLEGYRAVVRFYSAPEGDDYILDMPMTEDGRDVPFKPGMVAQVATKLPMSAFVPD
jgi:hypothetical protein